jgi:hypothetical protein
MFYKTYIVKMRDMRGGFPGFRSKEPAKPLIDGVLHVISKEDVKFTDGRLKIFCLGGELIREQSSRPFTEAEFKALLNKFQQELNKPEGGFVATCVPNHSSNLRPFT